MEFELHITARNQHELDIMEECSLIDCGEEWDYGEDESEFNFHFPSN